MLVGVSGVAGSGKDLFTEVCMEKLNELNRTSKKFSLANALKGEVREWCLDHYGIDSLDCSREDKEKIRNFLVAHGTTKRHATQGRHWVEQLAPEINHHKDNYDYLFVTDVRYCDYSEDEVHWLKNEMGGVLIHISQFSETEGSKAFRQPANSEEARNDPNLIKAADYALEWEFKPESAGKNEYVLSKVDEFIRWLLSYRE